jgi:hypothetical protein
VRDAGAGEHEVLPAELADVGPSAQPSERLGGQFLGRALGRLRRFAHLVTVVDGDASLHEVIRRDLVRLGVLDEDALARLVSG